MTQETKPINAAVVGLGRIGLRHAELISKHPDAKLVAVCDLLPPHKTGFYGDARYYFHLSELLNQEKELDLIHICTPNGLHAPMAMEILGHHKHVVIEKPMALTSDHARSIVAKAAKVKREVFVVKQNRFSPPMQWINQLLLDKMLGEIFMVQVNCFWNRDERYYHKTNWQGSNTLDGGTLFTQFSHFVDMLCWLLGPMQPVYAQFRDFNHQNLTDFEDSGTVTLELQQGSLATLTYSTSVYDRNMESSLTILGSKGSVKIAGQYMNELAYCHIENYQPPTLKCSEPPNHYGLFTGSAANHGQMIDHIIHVLQGKEANQFSGKEAIQVVKLIESIYTLRPSKEILNQKKEQKKHNLIP